eukprot:6197234-Pleurochrysis_carterae.AAC.2
MAKVEGQEAGQCGRFNHMRRNLRCNMHGIRCSCCAQRRQNTAEPIYAIAQVASDICQTS